MLHNTLIQLPWWSIRLTALIVAGGVLFDFEVLFLVQGFLLLHTKIGLESIIADYIHDTTVRLIYLTLLRILILEIILCSLEFFL